MENADISESRKIFFRKGIIPNWQPATVFASCIPLQTSITILTGRMANIHEEEALGKAYDSLLMKRLLTYLRPYKWQVAVALVSILIKAGADVLGPFLTKIVVDRYLAPVRGAHTPFDRFLSNTALVGIAQIAVVYVCLLLFSFLLEYLQTYY